MHAPQTWSIIKCGCKSNYRKQQSTIRVLLAAAVPTPELVRAERVRVGTSKLKPEPEPGRILSPVDKEQDAARRFLVGSSIGFGEAEERTKRVEAIDKHSIASTLRGKRSLSISISHSLNARLLLLGTFSKLETFSITVIKRLKRLNLAR